MIAIDYFRKCVKANVDFKRVENIVAKDVALSYKLLRCNKFVCLRLDDVENLFFPSGLGYLGQEKPKMFVSLAVASCSCQIKAELYSFIASSVLSSVSVCLAISLFQGMLNEAFMIGLFSSLDALLDLSLENLVEQPLSKTVKVALRPAREGPQDLLALEETEHGLNAVDKHCAQ
ncbi:hypothetical protein O9993_20595 [Vibrio lentus]|nr:hypothetical protein [Vibrio lentus]